MTPRDNIEQRLRDAVALAPSADGLRWLDERVARAMSQPLENRRRGVSAARSFLRPVLILAALILLAGAVGAAVGLLDLAVDESRVPGWRTAWERAEVLGIRQTDAGVTVILERAYVDLNQVVVGIGVEGLPPPAPASDGTYDNEVLSWVADLRGPDGWRPDRSRPDGAARIVEGDSSAFLMTFASPPTRGGRWELAVSSVGHGAAGSMVRGTWRFQFELPEPVGTVVAADARDLVGGATLTLTELRISPTTISATISLEVAGGTVSYWSSGTGLEDAVRHGQTTFDLSHETLIDGGSAVNEYGTSAGSDDVTGTWEIEIPDLWYRDGGDDGDVHIVGPWTLAVEVP